MLVFFGLQESKFLSSFFASYPHVQILIENELPNFRKKYLLLIRIATFNRDSQMWLAYIGNAPNKSTIDSNLENKI